MKAATGCILVFCAVAVGGCGIRPTQIVDPTTITLKNALFEVADGLYALQQRTTDRPRAGLIADEVSVELNVSIKATETGSGTLTVANVPLNIGGTIGLTAKDELVNEANRGNKIVVKFKSLATADLSKGQWAVVIECAKNPQNPVCNPILFRHE